MIEIYLCDDEDAVRSQIQTALECKIFEENYDMKVVCSAANAQELLDAAENGKRGIYFLDVELKDEKWDGFRLGRELRRRDPHGTLVYITSYGDLAWRTFQYHLEAFDYIVKGAEPIGLSASRCLDEIHGRLLAECQAPTETFALRTGGMVRYVPLSEILFFETAPAFPRRERGAAKKRGLYSLCRSPARGSGFPIPFIQPFRSISRMSWLIRFNVFLSCVCQ